MQVGSLYAISGAKPPEMLWRAREPLPTVRLVAEDSYDDFAARLGVVLMDLRTRAGIDSQAKFAELLSISESKVQRWESGQSTPDAYEVSVLCGVLGVEPDELVFPKALTDRERELLRRVAKGRRRGSGPASRAS